jgi:Na+-transporting methylmalonyl-CoA/oxaloacetate decarboxylase gamma subunit
MIHSWQNVVNANGLIITVAGMCLVFFSLTLISYIISLTPLFLKIINRFFPEQDEQALIQKSKSKSLPDMDVVAAIGMALTYSKQTIKE